MGIDMLIRSTEEFVKGILTSEGTGHDWWHVVRVVNIAKKIHATENGNWEIIHLALLLHDVGDRKVINRDNDDCTIAAEFMTSLGIDGGVHAHVMRIIKEMSFSKSFDEGEKDNSIEFQIVQDADRLDAMGAIGIARAFAYGGSRGRLLYDPDYTPQVFTSSKDYKSAAGSTLSHFDEKLFLLRDGLNTKSAQLLANDRDKYMHEFVSRFLEEWDGRK